MAKIATVSSFVRPLALLLGLVLASCAGQEGARTQRDLTDPQDGYERIGYRPQHRQDRTLAIAPVTDCRGKLAEFAQGVYPVAYTRDEIWRRPVPTMISELLRDEIQGSGLFRTLAEPGASDWLLAVDLLEFHGGIEERPTGRHAFGRCSLRARIYGPRGENGERELLRKQDFEEEIRAEGSLLLPDPHGLAAASFRRASYRLLVDLDAGGRIADQRAERAAPADEPQQKDWSAAPQR